MGTGVLIRSAAPALPLWVASAAEPWGTGYSYGQQLLLFVLEQLVDLGHDLVGALLEVLLGPVEVVLADLAVLLEVLELLAGVAAGIPHRHPALLGPVPHHLHEVLPS